MNSNRVPLQAVAHAADTIIIRDLEVQYRVGVTEAERAQPQRLQISIELETVFHKAAASDDLADTIDYFAVCERVKHFGEGCHWQLIETVGLDLANAILAEFAPATVRVEVRKFVIPEAGHVAVRVTRTRTPE